MILVKKSPENLNCRLENRKMNFSVFAYTGLAPTYARNLKVTAIHFKTIVQNKRAPFANQENHSIIRMKFLH